ncbi:MAG: DUF3592 domain-containing protein [Phycisphaerae bacterium]
MTRSDSEFEHAPAAPKGVPAVSQQQDALSGGGPEDGGEPEDAQELAPAAATAQVPTVPRAPTARARQRSWGEQPVRLWALTAVVLLLATVVVTITSTSNALRIRELLTQGIEAEATIITFIGTRTPSFARNQAPSARIEYVIDGRTFDAQDELPSGPGQWRVGDTVPIRVDPQDPMNFDYPGGVGWWTAMVKIILVLPFALLVTVVAFVKRRGMMKLWRDGEVAEAEVVAVKQTALAPLSSYVGFRYSYGYDNRVYHLYWPNKLGRLEPGDVLNVLRPKDKRRPAVAAGAWVG